MVDWNGLFNWSVKYHDGTTATSPEFQPMSDEDKKWLEEAMKQYTFNDADRLKEICEQLKNDHNFKLNEDKIYELFDECEELIEIHERNQMNLCLLGGLECLLRYMLHHPSDKIRKICCSTFSQVVQNNAEVQ